MEKRQFLNAWPEVEQFRADKFGLARGEDK